ncbi:MAG: hypothetical protein RR623_01685 [Bacilli bacterium]
MNLELLTANSVEELTQYIEKNPESFFISKRVKRELLNDLTALRNFLFTGNIICICTREKDEIEQLIIIEKQNIYKKNEMFVKCHGSSCNREFILESIKMLKDLLEFPLLKKLKLICIKDKYNADDFKVLEDLGFFVEIEYNLGNEHYWELAFIVE